MTKKKTKILALDSATQICSVALRDEEGSIHVRTETGRGIHSELLFVFIDELLKECNIPVEDLDAVLISMGPGSYTGLRIAASAVKGLLFNRNIPLYGINTLAYFSQCAFKTGEHLKRVHAIIDARRVHVYHQLFFEDDTINAVTDVEIREINSLPSVIQPGDGIIGTGLNRMDAGILDSVQVIGMEHIEASGLIELLDSSGDVRNFETKNPLIKKVAPNDFVPYYYGSVQVKHNVR